MAQHAPAPAVLDRNRIHQNFPQGILDLEWMANRPRGKVYHAYELEIILRD